MRFLNSLMHRSMAPKVAHANAANIQNGGMLGAVASHSHVRNNSIDHTPYWSAINAPISHQKNNAIFIRSPRSHSLGLVGRKQFNEVGVIAMNLGFSVPTNAHDLATVQGKEAAKPHHITAQPVGLDDMPIQGILRRLYAIAAIEFTHPRPLPD